MRWRRIAFKLSKNKKYMEQIQQQKSLYDRWYKIIILVPVLLMVISLSYIVIFTQKNGDVIYKDITLKGGTTITVNSPTDLTKLNQYLTGKLSEFDTKAVSDLATGKQIAFIVDTTEQPDVAKKVIEDYLGFQLDNNNSSVEFTGSTLGGGFYNQLRIAVIISFILMSIVVFIVFRTFVPSFTVIYCAFVDILMTLAVVDISGIKVSSAGVVAFLMLIGYSVDSDILLTTRVLRRKDDSINSAVSSAFKTGLTMTLTALAAVVVSLLITRDLSSILSQIFTILTIGLLFDIFNTWITNASIIKWYAESKLK